MMIIRKKRISGSMKSMESSEDKVFRSILGIKCSIPGINTFPSNGLIIGSKSSKISIKALLNPNQDSIRGVPVENRESCKILLLESVKRPLGSEGSDRVHLLCSAAFAGSGKTVLQAFNMHWFVQETKGIAVEVTFNDDQYGLWKGENSVASKKDLEQAIAVRILHRVVAHFVGDVAATSAMRKNKDELQGMIASMDEPLKASLRLLRRLLNAPADTKILLGVDELSKASSDCFSPVDMLRVPTEGHLDKDEALFLSVTNYGAIDLNTFATSYDRPLLLQTLSPIWHAWDFDPLSIHLLPRLLQPFFDKNQRLHLPNDSES
jgi:hypothetical protein